MGNQNLKIKITVIICVPGASKFTKNTFPNFVLLLAVFIILFFSYTGVYRPMFFAALLNS